MTGLPDTGLPDVLQGILAGPDSAFAGKGAGQASRSSDLIARAMELHGPGVLLSAGLLLHKSAVTPTLACLRRDPDPRVIAAKLMRLEGYFRAPHRTRVEQAGSGRWDCTRESSGSPSGLGENCLIAGALMGLLRDTGHGNIAVTIGGSRIEARDVLRASLAEGETGARFTITWTGRDVPPPAPEPESPALSDHLAALLDTDIGRSWRIGGCAQALGLPARSLQRYLKAEGSSFSSVLRQARMRAAAVLLADPAVSLAETGFCCGYADQAHFQRDFRRAMGTTPKRFRGIGAILQ